METEERSTHHVAEDKESDSRTVIEIMKPEETAKGSETPEEKKRGRSPRRRMKAGKQDLEDASNGPLELSPPSSEARRRDQTRGASAEEKKGSSRKSKGRRETDF